MAQNPQFDEANTRLNAAEQDLLNTIADSGQSLTRWPAEKWSSLVRDILQVNSQNNMSDKTISTESPQAAEPTNTLSEITATRSRELRFTRLFNFFWNMLESDLPEAEKRALARTILKEMCQAQNFHAECLHWLQLYAPQIVKAAVQVVKRLGINEKDTIFLEPGAKSPPEDKDKLLAAMRSRLCQEAMKSLAAIEDSKERCAEQEKLAINLTNQGHFSAALRVIQDMHYDSQFEKIDALQKTASNIIKSAPIGQLQNLIRRAVKIATLRPHDYDWEKSYLLATIIKALHERHDYPHLKTILAELEEIAEKFNAPNNFMIWSGVFSALLAMGDQHADEILERMQRELDEIRDAWELPLVLANISCGMLLAGDERAERWIEEILRQIPQILKGDDPEAMFENLVNNFLSADAPEIAERILRHVPVSEYDHAADARVVLAEHYVRGGHRNRFLPFINELNEDQKTETVYQLARRLQIFEAELDFDTHYSRVLAFEPDTERPRSNTQNGIGDNTISLLYRPLSPLSAHAGSPVSYDIALAEARATQNPWLRFVELLSLSNAMVLTPGSDSQGIFREALEALWAYIHDIQPADALCWAGEYYARTGSDFRASRILEQLESLDQAYFLARRLFQVSVSESDLACYVQRAQYDKRASLLLKPLFRTLIRERHEGIAFEYIDETEVQSDFDAMVEGCVDGIVDLYESLVQGNKLKEPYTQLEFSSIFRRVLTLALEADERSLATIITLGTRAECLQDNGLIDEIQAELRDTKSGNYRPQLLMSFAEYGYANNLNDAPNWQAKAIDAAEAMEIANVREKTYLELALHLGRLGKFDDAEKLIRRMAPDSAATLQACLDICEIAIASPDHLKNRLIAYSQEITRNLKLSRETLDNLVTAAVCLWHIDQMQSTKLLHSAFDFALAAGLHQGQDSLFSKTIFTFIASVSRSRVPDYQVLLVFHKWLEENINLDFDVRQHISMTWTEALCDSNDLTIATRLLPYAVLACLWQRDSLAAATCNILRLLGILSQSGHDAIANAVFAANPELVLLK